MAPTKSKRTLCKKKILTGECIAAASCPYAHHERELRLENIPSRADYKMVKCPKFDAGFCNLGVACKDIHGDEMDYPICPMIRMTGKCYFPDNCPFKKHPFVKNAVPYTPNHSRTWNELNMP